MGEPAQRLVDDGHYCLLQGKMNSDQAAKYCPVYLSFTRVRGVKKQVWLAQ